MSYYIKLLYNFSLQTDSKRENYINYIILHSITFLILYYE